jgi:LPS-assembly lipoprotein
MSWYRAAVVFGALFFVGACGFEPLYGQKSGSSVVSDLAATKINLIEDRIGQQLRNTLVEEFAPGGASQSPRYLLDVKLQESKSTLAIRVDETTSRAVLEIQAAFTLRRANDGQVLYDGLSRATTSYNVVNSDFATVNAEADARKRAIRVLGDDIKLRLASYFNQGRN